MEEKTGKHEQSDKHLIACYLVWNSYWQNRLIILFGRTEVYTLAVVQYYSITVLRDKVQTLNIDCAYVHCVPTK